MPPAKTKVATLRFPCLQFKQGHRSLALFSAPAKTLWNVLKINRKVEDKDEGYQRTLSPARVDRIAEFVAEGNVLPNSLLISLDAGASISADGGTITVPNKPDAGWVIDGQHRLAGAHKSKKDVSLPVVAFIGLDVKEQIRCFVTINREQKGVPSSLYYELLKHLPGSKSETELAKERAADLASLLKKDELSPFYRRIVTVTAPKQGEISLTNFVRRVGPHLHLTKGRLAIYPDETRAGILNNYFKGLGAVFSKEFSRTDSIFFKTLGFGALMLVLPTVMDITLQRGGFSVADVTETFKLVDFIDVAAWHKRGTGSQAENAAAEDLRSELMNSLKPKQGQGQTLLKLS